MSAADPDPLVGKRDSDSYAPEVAAQFAEDDRLIVEEEKSIINQERCDRSASGAPRWVMTTKVPMMDEAGRVLRLVGDWQGLHRFSEDQGGPPTSCKGKRWKPSAGLQGGSPTTSTIS
jgi:PAS domain-containing protein